MHRNTVGTVLARIGGVITVGAFCAFFLGAGLSVSSSGESYSGLVLILLPASLVAGAVGTVILVCGRRWHGDSPSNATKVRRPEECICPNCGSQNTRGSGKCVWCGANLD
jgi:hypothetical protein